MLVLCAGRMASSLGLYAGEAGEAAGRADILFPACVEVVCDADHVSVDILLGLLFLL